MNDFMCGFLMALAYWLSGGFLFWICIGIVEYIYPKDIDKEKIQKELNKKFVGKIIERSNHHV